jgi:DeoR/GlpR family transcriptional regulator of sugar metabolism
MIRVSSEVTVVAHASKFGRRSLSLIGKIECAQRIITDNRVEEETASALRAMGVDLVVV